MDILQTTYYVYIVTNESRSRLETGLTANLSQRLVELTGNAYLYDASPVAACQYLVYFETYTNLWKAFRRELKLSRFWQWQLRRLVRKKNPSCKPLNTVQNLYSS